VKGTPKDSARVLVVDDDERVRTALARLLRRMGHEVEVAEGGLPALERLERGGIDLVLLDVIMPDLDGLNVLKRLSGDVRVVMVSGADDTKLVADCIQEGADDFLPKPFDATVLSARIQSSLAKKRLRDLERRYVQHLEEEERKKERLISSMLPPPIAMRLQEGEENIAELVDDVTVIFADIVGFTQLSLDLEPEPLVKLLNRIFRSFDQLCAQHGVEKIKTIGDAYLAVGGLPGSEGDHTAQVAALAIEMRRVLPLVTGRDLSLRIGIHAGPSVTGVIGSDKLSFDLWGPTVNLASRLETHGLPGRIQVSSVVAQRLAGRFALEPRGSVHLQGIGEVDTWLLEPLQGS